MPSGFVPMGAVAEEYQMHGNPAAMGHVPLEARLGAGQSMEAEEYLGTGMDVDGPNFWWDQSFGSAFEADSSQMNPLPDGSAAYHYEPYSFS